MNRSIVSLVVMGLIALPLGAEARKQDVSCRPLNQAKIAANLKKAHGKRAVEPGVGAAMASVLYGKAGKECHRHLKRSACEGKVTLKDQLASGKWVELKVQLCDWYQ